jgi:carbon storage regulator
MLVLSRKVGQKIVLGDQVTITINRISGGRVSLGITAPPGVRVVRSELGPLDSSPVGGATNPASDVGFSNPTAPASAMTTSPNPSSQR